jgi:hypothetical protein
VVRQPTVFLDLVPAPAGTTVPDGGGLPEREQAQQYLATHDLQALLQLIADERLKEITTLATHMELSLNALINRQQIRLAENRGFDLISPCRSQPGVDGVG